ncbi:hypothetical protein OEZ85_008179 [Tetradesmus obliquus]|uniref:Protein kinase domain-containing protein n=1 Tax=Tetradesmus obliquus TaxID=3088 RepID=A0ABY8TI40_TETOB|nr:hypothetical protein OEZ85_008179 [Tetradesmus obliquus]
MMSAISRRISPILSVFEDGSSATSNDSFAGPAAWHTADRQMLEETPGWLNIDFAREVRLERKLGEGGFGQVFRARWRHEVLAAKLVPFMSLVAHTSQCLPVTLVSADHHAGSSSSAAGLARTASPQPPGSAAAASPSTTAAADAVGVGMQFSAASLRAIKMEIKPQVVHRDLKPQNVLLDLQGRAKVCDFGISKMKDASMAASSTRLQAGTPAYMAPEQFEGCSATEKVDVFSFAVLLWECCQQQQPWRDLSPMQIIYAVGLQKERLKRPVRCPDGLWRLIEACWQQQPEARPSFASILATLQQLEAELQQQQQQQQQHEASSHGLQH